MPSPRLSFPINLYVYLSTSLSSHLPSESALQILSYVSKNVVCISTAAKCPSINVDKIDYATRSQPLEYKSLYMVNKIENSLIFNLDITRVLFLIVHRLPFLFYLSQSITCRVSEVIEADVKRWIRFHFPLTWKDNQARSSAILL